MLFYIRLIKYVGIGHEYYVTILVLFTIVKSTVVLPNTLVS